MKHASILSRLCFAAAVIGLMGVLVGCGSEQPQVPSAPERIAPAGQTAVVLGHPGPVGQSPGTSQSPAGPSDQMGGGSGGSTGGSGMNQLVTVTKAVNGAVGGIVSAGRYTLTIPAGAFSGVRSISITDAQLSRPQCSFSPEGMRFNTPALLSMNLRSTSYDRANVTIYWLDTTKSTWVDLNGIFSKTGHQVRTSVTMLSTFRAGARD